MTDTSAKYEGAAEGWSEEQYADSEAYLRHRAELIVALGPRLEPGDRILDLACGDGGLADFLRPFEYVGVDASEAMARAARARGARVELADLNDYEPPEPVAATTVFRALYYADDRAAFFRRVAGFTTRKLVFDLNPRQFPLATIRGELAAAGFGAVAVRPFLVPQNVALPSAVRSLAIALEPTPLARLALRFRFTYVISASR